MDDRAAFIAAYVDEECVGCEDVPSHDSETGEPLIGFRPAERCPVHGRDTRDFWRRVNAEERRRFPADFQTEATP